MRLANGDWSENAAEPALLKFKETLPPGRSASKTRSMCRRTENQKFLLLLYHSTPVQAMSAINRLLFALGWISPPEQDSCWGERPPQKPTDRRMSVRNPACGKDAYLGWWIGEEFHSVAGQFRDISSGGALILTRE